MKSCELLALCPASHRFCIMLSCHIPYLIGPSRFLFILGVNPFILPVATLCFKLAEHRVSQRDRYLERQATNPSVTGRTRKSGGGRQESMDDYLADPRAFLTDVLRLLKNCLNLIGTMEEGAGEACERSQALPSSRSSSPDRPPSLRPYADLKSRALLLLCRLYLSSPPDDIMACASLVLRPTPAAPEVGRLVMWILLIEAFQFRERSEFV